MRLILVQQQEPPMAQSIMVRAEKVLNSSHVQSCLELIAERKNMGLYKSVIDFLLSELFPEIKPLCMEYYAGTGDLLKNQISADLVQHLDIFLVNALHLAVEMRKEKDADIWRHMEGGTPRFTSWGAFRCRLGLAA